LRAELGISQYDLAERLVEVSGNPSMTREQVNRWERHKRLPTPYWRRYLAIVLDVPRPVLDRATALARQQRARDRSDESRAVEERAAIDSQTSPMLDHVGTLEESLERWDELMRRRDFLASAGAAALAGTLPPVIVESQDGPAFTATFAAGSQADLIGAHQQLHAVHGRLDNLHGPAAVYRPAYQQHQQLLYWHQQVASVSARRESAALVAVTGGFIGWLNFDLAHFGEAVQWFRHAASLAAEAGDISLCANNLGQAARALAAADHHRDALASIDLALATAGTAAHPAVRSWLHAVRSDQHARHGDGDAACADLRTATTLFDRVEADQLPVYIGYLDAAELDKWTGRALVRLGATNRPVLSTGAAAIERARKAWRPGHYRGLAEVLTTAARAALVSGELEQAVSMMHQAHDIAERTGSTRNLRAVNGLGGELVRSRR
jgi:hypothetical protein